MSSSNTINYREMFPKTDLTPILDIPTFETVHQLIQEVKANAASVHSNLGGGAHGHLGLVLSPRKYALLSDAPYERPTHPGVLDIPNGATRHATDHLTRTHKEQLRVFHEVRGVEQALLSQITSAINDMYIMSFKNRITGQYTGNVLDILNFLQDRYGKISHSQLIAFEQDVTNFIFDPLTPVENVYNKIEDLMDYGELAAIPYSQHQIIVKAYNIFNSCGVFRDYIKLWNRRPAHEHTWVNFKQHFRDAQKELEETNELTLQNTGYGQANIVDEIVERTVNQITSELNNRTNLIPSSAPAPSPSPTPTPPAPQANMATPSSTDALIQQLLEQNQALMRQLLNAPNGTNNNRRRNNRQRFNRPSTGRRTGQPAQPLPDYCTKYCWTHGRCTHTSNECLRKAPGHQDNATFDNKLDGSTYGCE